MINKKFLIIIIVIAVVAALASVLILLAANSNNIVIDVSSATSKIESVLPPRSEGTAEKRYNSEMPVMNIDGNDFIGLIEVPERNVKLPVYSKWNEKAVRIVPCRYSGSIYDLNLIIGGTEMNGGFEFLTSLEKGETVTFTEMTGKEYTFKVDSVFHRDDFEINNEGDLILFSYMNDVSKYIFIKCK